MVLASHVSSQRRINSYLQVYSRTSPLCRRTCVWAGQSSQTRKEHCHTSAHHLLHALVKFSIQFIGSCVTRYRILEACFVKGPSRTYPRCGWEPRWPRFLFLPFFCSGLLTPALQQLVHRRVDEDISQYLLFERVCRQLSFSFGDSGCRTVSKVCLLFTLHGSFFAGSSSMVSSDLAAGDTLRSQLGRGLQEY